MMKITLLAAALVFVLSGSMSGQGAKMNGALEQNNTGPNKPSLHASRDCVFLKARY